MKCPRAVVVALAVVSAGATHVSSPASAAVPPAGGLPGVKVPTLAWTDCGDGYQCRPAQVPLDYHRPDGTQVTLQLRRRPAADPAARIGTLFIYAGGPGSSVWSWVEGFATSSSEEISDRFDIVGFDPRGVQRSQPVNCLDGQRTGDSGRRRQAGRGNGPSAQRYGWPGSGTRPARRTPATCCRTSARSPRRATSTCCGRRSVTRS